MIPRRTMFSIVLCQNKYQSQPHMISLLFSEVGHFPPLSLPIGKALHDVGVMCKTLYFQLLRKEISSYSLAEKDMFENLEATKKKLNFSKFSGSVPYLYGNLKLHKLPGHPTTLDCWHVHQV